MAYFNYHAKIKNKIKEGKCVRVEVVNEYKKVKPAMVFYFTDDNPMFVRDYRFMEYYTLLNDLKMNDIIINNIIDNK